MLIEFKSLAHRHLWAAMRPMSPILALIGIEAALSGPLVRVSCPGRGGQAQASIGAWVAAK